MRHAKATLTMILASAVYLTLAIFTINYAFGVAPSLEWAQETFGRLAGGRIWSHSAHAAGVFLAAIPPALILCIVSRIRAVSWAAITGVFTSVAAVVPTFMHPGVRPHLDTSSYVVAAIDSIKMVLILMLVTWLFTKLSSNYAMRRSSRQLRAAADRER